MDLLVGDVFANAAAVVPDRIAIVAGDDRVTFGRLDDLGDRLAAVLQASGIGLGDRVVVWAADPVELAALWVATARCGAVFAPVNTRLRAAEAAALAEVARPTVLLVDEARRGEAPGVAAALGCRWASLADLLAEASARDGDAARPAPVPGLVGTSPHVIFFTSGSTGRPKGVVLAHQTTVLRCHPGSQIEPRGLLVCPFPQFHMAAWTLSMQQWHARDGVVLTGATGEEIAAAVHEHRAERVYLIPAVWRRVLDHLATPVGEALDLSCLRFVDTGTSATPPALLDELAKVFPDAVRRVFYGSTEAANVAALDEADFDARPGSCGAPSPMVQARVGAERELQVRSPLLFDGYFEDEAATTAAFADGWYRTGDRVEQDGDGFFYITGRASDVIRTGGEGVDPVEVEQVLLGHPDVLDVAVVGVPDEQWGEIVCAVVVVPPGRLPSLEELRRHCGDHLAPHKHPRRVEASPAIPRTPATLQVQRSLVLEALASAAPS